MKSLFLATAAVAALAAAPALAQDGVGSVGITYANTEIDALGVSAEGDGLLIDGAFAVPVGADWAVTVEGDFAYAFDGGPQTDDSTVSGRVHASRNFGGMRLGAFVGGSNAGDETLWSVGAEAQKYMDKLTLTGSVAYETVDGVDADIWSVGGDAAYFITPRFRVNAGAGWSNIDAGVADADGWQANVGGEYLIPGTAMGLTANYTHAEFEDFDVQADTFMVGFRVSFGGDLQTRDRSGADLGRTAAGIGALAGSF